MPCPIDVVGEDGSFWKLLLDDTLQNQDAILGLWTSTRCECTSAVFESENSVIASADDTLCMRKDPLEAFRRMRKAEMVPKGV